MVEEWVCEVGPRVDQLQPVSPTILKGLMRIRREVCSSPFFGAFLKALSVSEFMV